MIGFSICSRITFVVQGSRMAFPFKCTIRFYNRVPFRGIMGLGFRVRVPFEGG